ncbi:hypothetical protein B983_02439 [Brucella abortus 67/93]|nr:hypothetical protein C079_02241 [Brucella abortus 65/157]ENR80464.1 hypothetical protein B983_02439 [Brucella abortus 67/93]
MHPEFDIYGIYIPSLGLLALAAYFANTLMQRLLARVHFYRFVWHRLSMPPCISAFSALLPSS